MAGDTGLPSLGLMIVRSPPSAKNGSSGFTTGAPVHGEQPTTPAEVQASRLRNELQGDLFGPAFSTRVQCAFQVENTNGRRNRATRHGTVAHVLVERPEGSGSQGHAVFQPDQF